MKSNPLTESTFYILLALYEEPLHGYGIIKKVESLSDGKVILATGTLYGALENLRKSQLINLIDTKDESETRRKTYKLSSRGITVLTHDYNRIKKLCLVAENILDKGE